MSKTILKGETNRATSVDVSVGTLNETAALTGEHGCESKCLPASQQPAAAREEAIRALAHSKWEAAGCPAGDGFDFWLEAEREFNSEGAG